MNEQVNEEVVKSSEDMLAHLSTFSHMDQVEIFDRVKRGLIEMREDDLHRLKIEKDQIEQKMENLVKGSEYISK